eukprot:1644580-Pleurochrysis_carterae.AAC.1
MGPRRSNAVTSTTVAPSTTSPPGATVHSTHRPEWPDALPEDLRVSSSARALMTTRNARTAGHHSRNLPPHSKHIAF